MFFIAFFFLTFSTRSSLGSSGGSAVENLPASAGGVSPILGSGRSAREGNGNLLQHSCWEIPWTEEPGGVPSMGSQRVGHDWATETTAELSLGSATASHCHVSLASLNLKHFHSLPLCFKTLMFLRNTVPFSFFFLNRPFLSWGLFAVFSWLDPGYLYPAGVWPRLGGILLRASHLEVHSVLHWWR